MSEIIAYEKSFWSMITENRNEGNEGIWGGINSRKVLIPIYQRDYAQGRPDREVELIRRGLVSDLLNSLKKNTDKKVQLNFIFGGVDDIDESNAGVFTAVDGQQRLTTLFLIHWYFTIRSENVEYKRDLEPLKINFDYATRTTSSRFCLEILKLKKADNVSQEFVKDVLDFSIQNEYDEQDAQRIKKGAISSQIKQQPWFTGNIGNDLTVQSMLVVMDEIHGQFLREREQYPDTIDEIRNRIQSNDCPITFLCLDMQQNLGGDGAIRDLYVKMNARGKPLTDFEIFKAQLQKKKTGELGQYDILGEYFKRKSKPDSQSSRSEVIGRFNTQYTNFFFKLLDDGEIRDYSDGIKAKDAQEQLFDLAMMNFVNEIIRMYFFCYASELGVSQKTYRGDNQPIKVMSGKEFSSFVENKAKQYTEKYRIAHDQKKELPFSDDVQNKKVFTDAMDMIMTLLDRLSGKYVDSETTNPCAVCNCHLIDVDNLIKSLADDPIRDEKALPVVDTVKRMALFEYINIFGYPKNEDEESGYSVWSEFVWKIVKYTEYKNADEAVEAIRGFKKTLIALKNSKLRRADVYRVISNVNKDDFSAPCKSQLEEEIVKAKLITADFGEEKADWYKIIHEAEIYFSNEQIWFLLEMAKGKDGNYSYDEFEKYYNGIKRILTPELKLINQEQKHLFEQALLCNETDECNHLLSVKGGKLLRFSVGDYDELLSKKVFDSDANKYGIMIHFLKELIDNVDSGVEEYLSNLINSNKEGTNLQSWQRTFVENDVFDGVMQEYEFKNTIFFIKEKQNESDESFNYVMLSSTDTRTSGKSAELNTYILYDKLRSRPGVHLQLSTSSSYFEEGFPQRYVEIDGLRIGFVNGAYKSITGKSWMTIDEVMESLNTTDSKS